MDGEIEPTTGGISGRRFLIGGVGLLLAVAALAFLWTLYADSSPDSATFYGTPTATPAHEGLPF